MIAGESAVESLINEYPYVKIDDVGYSTLVNDGNLLSTLANDWTPASGLESTANIASDIQENLLSVEPEKDTNTISNIARDGNLISTLK